MDSIHGLSPVICLYGFSLSPLRSNAPYKEHPCLLSARTIAAGCCRTKKCRMAAVLFVEILNVTRQALSSTSVVRLDMESDFDLISLGCLQKQWNNFIFP